MKYINLPVILTIMLLSCNASNNKVEFKHDEANKEVEVWFGDSYFTSYIYPDDMEKQVLYPIVTESGKEITRGYPI
ncbi:MAG: hypothetical protein ACOC0R_02195, partial [Mariniphaga sp.]